MMDLDSVPGKGGKKGDTPQITMEWRRLEGGLEGRQRESSNHIITDMDPFTSKLEGA